MSWRLKRQLIYISIFSFFLLLFFVIFYNSQQRPPTCFDNKKNQGEEGIDCGGPCPPCELKEAQPLKVYSSQFVIYLDSIDLIGVVENPNKNLALKNLKYYFEIYDPNNLLRATTSIKETILEPEQKRFFLEINYPKPNFVISKVKLKVLEPKDQDWQKAEPQKLKFSIYNQKIYQENNKWKMSFTLFNPTFDNYSDLEIVILLYNENNQLIGTTKTIISLNREEVKDIILTLPEINDKPRGFEIIFQKTSL